MIQEHIKKPLADELLFGKLEHGGTVKVELEGEGLQAKLKFELIAGDPKRSKAREEEEEDDSEEDGEPETALIEAAPRKALPGPKEKRSSRPSGAVPSVPPKKES